MEFIVGVCHVSLQFRFARSLKDKHQALQGTRQKLKNLGFSVVDCSEGEDPKYANLGFVYAGDDYGAVEARVDEALRLFTDKFEVLHADKDVFHYADLERGTATEEDDLKYDP